MTSHCILYLVSYLYILYPIYYILYLVSYILRLVRPGPPWGDERWELAREFARCGGGGGVGGWVGVSWEGKDASSTS